VITINHINQYVQIEHTVYADQNVQYTTEFPFVHSYRNDKISVSVFNLLLNSVYLNYKDLSQATFIYIALLTIQYRLFQSSFKVISVMCMLCSLYFPNKAN